jgi:hypothetical protein
MFDTVVQIGLAVGGLGAAVVIFWRILRHTRSSRRHIEVGNVSQSWLTEQRAAGEDV